MHRQITGKLVIATHNPGKLAEMRELLAPGLASAGLVRAGDNKGLETAAALALRGDTALRQYL